MQLLWLICHLAVVTAIPLLPSSSFIRTRRTANTMNDTKADPDESQKPQICETAHCHEIAKRIQQNIDTTVNPCENFYQYACGSWGKNNPVPEGRDTWSDNNIVFDKSKKRIKELLEEHISSTDIPPVRMVKEFYRSCMNVDEIEKRGFEPIQGILNRTGGWPMAMPINEWDEMPWQKIDKEYISSMECEAFYSVGYDIDPNNRKRYILMIDPVINDLPSKKRDPIEAYMADITYIANTSARQSGYTLDENQLTSDVTEMVHFELLLTEITVKQLNSEYFNNNKRMTIEELQKYYNNFNITASSTKIDFLEIIQHICNEANIHVNSSEPILVYNPKFLHQLATLLGNTSQRTIVNYVQWNMVKKFMLYTTQEMRNIRLAKSDNFTDTTPRWKTCVNDLEMKTAISYMFVKRYMPDNVIHEVTKVVKNMKEELRNHLEQTHWLPSSIKLDMLQKTNNYGIEIGYPEWYKNDDAVTRYYDGLSIGSDYFQNILNVLKKKSQKLGILREVVKKSHWVDYPTSYNAYYNPETNTIILLATQMQDPYFAPHLPDAVNYGRGFVFGHELGHSFDRTGIEFNKDGKKIPWKSHNASKEYDKRAKCFVDQYSNYILHISNDTKEDIKLNGTNTNNEDIADSIGVRIAYSAYKKVEKEKIQSKLPGFENISNDKLFFLSLANYWCSTTKSGYDEYIEFDKHSPAKYRVVGALSNMAAFSEVFNCPQNSSMNRQHKCNLLD
ncbi:membrane metallo-endopeptidase-like 1 [Bombus impatiens]|uniref:Membrane metallo-endopeptidase-like 1 n=1 Tax=Bombus impatiens TaxID=132113 RepID=A0A6P6FE59_BOMIM|nr:membrane metallo-endopeptidase-like 1 [Bombus impatiens]